MIQLDFIPFPDLYTDRLYLRQLRMKDQNEVFALRSDERVNKFLNRPAANNIEDARQHIQRLNKGLAQKEAIMWAITLKGNDKLIGSVCLWKISKEHSKAEIGYELLPEYQGKGIMQEAIPTVIKYGFERIKLNTIEAELSPLNLKSIKLLEKNGFILLVENPKEDSLLYGLMNKS